ncbi:MAG: rhodanese-like domain-containing protein [Saprospiraceae bacterium]
MTITVHELKARLDNGDRPILIDVREPYEHEEFNIGPINIPVGQILSSVGDLEGHKNDEIVVYCRTGNRSGMAQHLLRAPGFTRVINLTGGMEAWKEAFGS